MAAGIASVLGGSLRCEHLIADQAATLVLTEGDQHLTDEVRRSWAPARRHCVHAGSEAVFVSDEHGDADAVIEATSNSLVTTIPLGGGAGNTVYDSGSGQILVAVHEKNELVAIDPAAAKIIGRIR
ncbi:MAG TPA: hypothetical protein VIX37_18760 [Candidatus Sulfotelmatobacter sp.]